MNERTRKYILPPDLSTWIDKRNLALVVSRIVQSVDDSKLQAAGFTAGGGSPQPRTMLTLLTFCYAAGICGSHKIRRCCDEDKTLGYLCANQSELESWSDAGVMIGRSMGPSAGRCLRK